MHTYTVAIGVTRAGVAEGRDRPERAAAGPHQGRLLGAQQPRGDPRLLGRRSAQSIELRTSPFSKKNSLLNKMVCLFRKRSI